MASKGTRKFKRQHRRAMQRFYRHDVGRNVSARVLVSVLPVEKNYDDADPYRMGSVIKNNIHGGMYANGLISFTPKEITIITLGFRWIKNAMKQWRDTTREGAVHGLVIDLERTKQRGSVHQLKFEHDNLLESKMTTKFSIRISADVPSDHIPAFENVIKAGAIFINSQLKLVAQADEKIRRLAVEASMKTMTEPARPIDLTEEPEPIKGVDMASLLSSALPSAADLDDGTDNPYTPET